MLRNFYLSELEKAKAVKDHLEYYLKKVKEQIQHDIDKKQYDIEHFEHKLKELDNADKNR